MNMRKCSLKKHSESEAISYCTECRINLCNKCQNCHSELFENHHIYNLGRDKKEIYTGFCQREKHNMELQYYCRNHNELCCAACLCKIKGQGNGQHLDCNVIFINEIKEEKKNVLKENIKNLENLSNSIQSSIDEIRELYAKINEKKEKIKLKIQKIFTKIRNELNDREDELLLEADKIFSNTYGDENIIKDGEKLPNKIKIALSEGKKLDSDWNDNDNDINKKIYDCINIEKIIEDINKINEGVKKCKINNEINIEFTPEENGVNDFLMNIKEFGSVSYGCGIIKFSDIIKDKNIEIMISNWINPKANLRFKLLYKVSRDGDRISTFTEKVKGKYPTLIIIQSKSGFRFGGYTSVEWDMTGNYNYKKDNSAFIFSIDKKSKYKLKENNSRYAICGDPDHFAFGGGHDLTIWDKCQSKDNSDDYSFNHTYEMKDKYELTGGKNKFYVQECEVYQVY